MKPILIDMSSRLVWVESEHGRVAIQFHNPAELWNICTNPKIAAQATVRPKAREAEVVYETVEEAIKRGVTIQKLAPAWSQAESERIRRMDAGELLAELGLDENPLSDHGSAGTAAIGIDPEASNEQAA